ncbi:MAG: Peptidase inhibitor family [Actinomycetota bacterium]|jgi:hypothetical protein
MKSLILGVLTAALALTACGPQGSTPEAGVSATTIPAPESSGSEMEVAPSDTAQAVADEVIGMSEAEAIETIAGISSEPLTSRIVRRDEESFMVTMDYRLDRINLEIDSGIVTKTSIG